MNASSIAAQASPDMSELINLEREIQPQVEAIRYAVLRKLAPGLRHALMGELQAIQLSAELSSRMLRVNADPVKIRETVGHMPEQCNAAVKTCRAVIEWLRPEDDQTVAVGAALKHCLKIAGDDWFLRGIEVVREPPSLDAAVAKAPFQELVVTTLLVLTDLHDAPMDLEVDAMLARDRAEISLAARRSDRVTAFPPASAYRKLTWADLRLIADLHSVDFAMAGDRVTLSFPLAIDSSATSQS